MQAQVGLAPSDHPLLQERGFYTVDGTHRMFTMPYTSAAAAKEEVRRT